MSEDKQKSRSFLVNLIKRLRNTLFHFLNAIAQNLYEKMGYKKLDDFYYYTFAIS